ncbi:MAG: penicillin-binding protein 2 [Candidatus Omnitrophica bacterium]|nr:penicillin-binding protein 2 [Candidatus Omnitrophota bacterium]
MKFQTIQRFRIFKFFIYASFLAIVAGLVFLQVVKFRYYQGLSLRNTIRIIPIEAPRGSIYDRNRNLLAVDEISFDLAVIAQEVKDLDATLEALSKISDIPKKKLHYNYKRNYYVPFAPTKVASDLDKEKAFYIEEKLSSVPGAMIWPTPRRYYPNKEVGSHVIGYVGRIARGEFVRLRDYGYKIQDLVGKSGIEKQYDAYLQGEDGGIQIEVDAASRQIRRRGFKEPKRGKDLVLTIDLGLQRFVDELLREKKGACIVMDSRTGQVLALSSSPNFDPNAFTTGTDKERLALLRSKGRPLIDRAISSSFPPGSTFKIVVAAAGIATGALDINTTFTCNGSISLGKWKFRCWKEAGHGPQNIVDALAHSCNVFFYSTGRVLGADQIYRYASKFGLGSTTGIDLPKETKGLVPNPIWKRLKKKEPWYKGDTFNYSIGQGFLLVTPIQMLRVVAIVANAGKSPTPYLLEKIEDRDVSHSKVFNTGLKKNTFKFIRKGLFDVVNSRTGTGQNARVRELGVAGKVAGKTGTAQPGTRGSTHAWFVGYLPSNAPMISFVVFLEHGGQGGRESARIARLVGTYLDENGFLE